MPAPKRQDLSSPPLHHCRAAKNASAEHLIKVGQDQGIAPVVDLLRSTEETVQQGAAAALWSLSVTTENKIKIVERGGLPLLIRMLRSEDEGSQEQAAGCLYSLSVLAENKLNIVQEGGLAPLVGLCESLLLESLGDVTFVCDLLDVVNAR